MNPRDYLRIAEDILLRSQGAAECRTAINRAYYGAYGAADVALQGFGCVIPRQAPSHELVRDILQTCGDSELAKAGNYLNQLYDWRQKADYRYADTRPENIKAARYALNHAAKIVAIIDAALVEPRRTQLVPLFGRWRVKTLP